MRIDELLNPGAYSGSQSLRARVAHAISFAEVVTRFRDSEAGPNPTAAALAAFLADAASKTPGYVAPTPTLPDNQAIVEDGDVVTIGGQTATIAVEESALTGVALPATAGVVTDGQVLAVTGGTVTLSVADGVVTAEYTAA